jgi:hypothetical protein
MLAEGYATGRASHATQVKFDDPDEKRYPGPSGWGLGVGLITPHRKNNLFRNPTISHGREEKKDREQWRLVVEETKAHTEL